MNLIKYCIIGLIILNISSYAQDTNTTNKRKPIFYIGAFLGFDFNFHNADFDKLPGYANCCPKFDGGSGMGYSLGIATNFPFSDKLSLDTRFSITSLNGLLTKQQFIGFTELRNSEPPFETTDILNATSEYEIDASIQTIGIEPALKFDLYKGISLFTGIRLGILNSSTFDQKEKLISPTNVVFKENGTLVRNEFKLREIPETNSMQFHYLVGASYKHSLRNSIVIEPDFRFLMPLTNISLVNWSVSQFQLSIAAMFPLFKPIEMKTIKEDVIRRDTSIIAVLGLNKETISLVSSDQEVINENLDDYTIIERNITNEKYERRVPKESILNAFLTTIGINNDGSEVKDPTIVIEETEIYETFPLLPYVFFYENDSLLANTDQKMLEKFQAQNFKEEHLDQNTFEVYYNLLNVIGYRMNKYPDAKIMIVGTNNNLGVEKGNIELSKQRALAVKNYLSDVWKIDSKRIDMESRNLPKKPANNDHPEGIEENRRAEIYSDNFEILKPITILEISKKASPPKVKITPNIKSDVGIKKWDIVVYQDKTAISRFNDKDEELIWDIEKGILPELEKPVDIELNVEDVIGKKATAVKSLEIKQLTIKKKREEFVNDKRIEKFALILFDYNRADLKQEHKQILSDIKSRITPESMVTISGYADATGEQDYNHELASKRTKNVVKELGLIEGQVIINNIGSDKLLFDNSKTYGRSFCRTVTILIETPINSD